MFYGIKGFVLALQKPDDPVDIQALQRDAVLYMAAACAAMVTFNIPDWHIQEYPVRFSDEIIVDDRQILEWDMRDCFQECTVFLCVDQLHDDPAFGSRVIIEFRFIYLYHR